VIAAAGYGALGLVLAAGTAASAVLVLRVRDPLEQDAAVPAMSEGLSLGHGRERRGG
jgi:hypothetical protein